MIENKKENSNWNVFLFIVYWLALIVECVGLYKRNYYVYGFSRILLTPILLVRVFWSPAAWKLSLYIYIFLLCSLLADLFSIFGNETIAYLGLNLFTVSYLLLGCYFTRLKSNYKSNALIIFFLALVSIGASCALWLYVPQINAQVFFVQTASHCLVLLFMVYALFIAYQKIVTKSFSVFLLAVLFILLANALYALDARYFHWQYPVVESLIGLGNGVYLFMVVRGALNNVKKG